MINVSSKDSDYSVTSELPKPYRDGFTEEQMATLREYARTVLQQERERDAHPIDTAILYGDDFDAAMLELARVVYTVAEQLDMPHVTTTAFYHDRDCSNRGHAYGQVRDTGEFTETMIYYPQEGEK